MKYTLRSLHKLKSDIENGNTRLVVVARDVLNVPVKFSDNCIKVLVDFRAGLPPQHHKKFKKWVKEYEKEEVDILHLYSFVYSPWLHSYYKPEYWMFLKGCSYSKALTIIEQYKSNKVTSEEGFVKRHGIKKGKELFIKFQLTSGSAVTNRTESDLRESSWMCEEFYMKRGYTRDEAKVLVSEAQVNRAGVNRNIWEEKGYSEKEIDLILKDQYTRKGWRDVNILKNKYPELSDDEIKLFISNANNKMIDTFADKGFRCPRELKEEFNKYRNKAYSIVRSLDLSSLDDIELRGEHYHVDHKMSILEGFINDVPVELISNINNLRCIPKIDNLRKGVESSITLEEFYENCKNN